MNIRVKHGLLYISVSLIQSGRQIICENVLPDTGSSGTVFSAERVIKIGIIPEPDDPVCELRGVGGTEFVFVRRVDKLTMGNFQTSDFEIKIGAMDYGMKIDGIIGLVFLLKVKAKIDVECLKIYQRFCKNKGINLFPAPEYSFYPIDLFIRLVLIFIPDSDFS